jgi:pimeloyl-ACP methyl ester carboxylesterase
MTTTVRNASAATAPNEFVEDTRGVRYAYRRIGVPADGTPPLVLLQHFRGNLDTWDPLLLDTLAAGREVIAFDNAGIGLSNGTTPPTVTEMARDAIAFADALEIDEFDLLGFSIGGMVAQEVALLRPQQVRRIVLAATGPRGGGAHMHGWIVDIARLANASNNGPEEYLRIFFSATETSRKQGMDYFGRLAARTDERDAPVSEAAQRAQYDAVVEWGIPERSRLERLSGIRQPVLVTSGDNDTMIPTANAFILGHHLPNARVRIFDDSGHGFLFQWPVACAQLVNEFLA